MADSILDDALSTYLARPVTGDRLAASYNLSTGLVGVLQQLAAERGVPLDALVEHYLFKAVRAEHARRLVEEAPDAIPASFLNDRVAAAKDDLREVVANTKAHEERGDKATRLVNELEARLGDPHDDPHLDAVQRRAAEGDARIDAALLKRK